MLAEIGKNHIFSAKIDLFFLIDLFYFTWHEPYLVRVSIISIYVVGITVSGQF
jgi:hypothetical protein